MNDKQRRFVEEYLVDLNATQAAIRAGYSEKTAYSQGQRLLSNVEVAQAIEEAQAERSERTEITQDMVLQELAKIGFANMQDFMTDDGLGRPLAKIQDLTRDQAAALAEVTFDTIAQAGEDAPDIERIKFKLHDKRAALVDLGKHLGMFNTAKSLDITSGGKPLAPTRVEFVPVPVPDAIKHADDEEEGDE